MSFPTQSNSIAASYRPATIDVQRDIAKHAFTDAIEYFKKELQGNGDVKVLLDGNAGLIQIHTLVLQTQAKYLSSASQNKCLSWLRKFSERIIHYERVLDTLAQHHAEYTALVWGAMKFIFLGISNHAKLVSHFSKALAKIGEALSHAKLSAELYQTQHMKDAIAQLYAHILLFFQHAIRWYKLGSTRRVLSAFVKPYETDYKETVDQVRACSQTVCDIAEAASRAELRDMHVLVQLQFNSIQEQDRKLNAMQNTQKEIQHKMEVHASQLIGLGTCHKSITERIDLNILDIKPRIYSIQLSTILNGLKPKQSPHQMLLKSQSLVSRNMSFTPSTNNTVDTVRKVNGWLTQDQSSLFIVKVDACAETAVRGLSTQVINLLKQSHGGVNVFWRLSPGSFDSDPQTIEDAIQSLIFQIIQANPGTLDICNMDPSKFQSHHTESEWFSLLTQLLSKMSPSFLIIETEDLARNYRHDKVWADRVAASCRDMVHMSSSSGACVKILLVLHTTTSIDTSRLEGIENVVISTSNHTRQQQEEKDFREKESVGSYTRAIPRTLKFTRAVFPPIELNTPWNLSACPPICQHLVY